MQAEAAKHTLRLFSQGMKAHLFKKTRQFWGRVAAPGIDFSALRRRCARQRRRRRRVRFRRTQTAPPALIRPSSPAARQSCRWFWAPPVQMPFRPRSRRSGSASSPPQTPPGPPSAGGSPRRLVPVHHAYESPRWVVSTAPQSCSCASDPVPSVRPSARFAVSEADLVGRGCAGDAGLRPGRRGRRGRAGLPAGPDDEPMRRHRARRSALVASGDGARVCAMRCLPAGCADRSGRAAAVRRPPRGLEAAHHAPESGPRALSTAPRSLSPAPAPVRPSRPCARLACPPTQTHATTGAHLQAVRHQRGGLGLGG